jgi:hypothetical protein
MNKKSRQELFNKLIKQAEQELLLKKIAEDNDLNNATDSASYSEQLFDKLLSEIKIDGLED